MKYTVMFFVVLNQFYTAIGQSYPELKIGKLTKEMLIFLENKESNCVFGINAPDQYVRLLMETVIYNHGNNSFRAIDANNQNKLNKIIERIKNSSCDFFEQVGTCGPVELIPYTHLISYYAISGNKFYITCTDNKGKIVWIGCSKKTDDYGVDWQSVFDDLRKQEFGLNETGIIVISELVRGNSSEILDFSLAMILNVWDLLANKTRYGNYYIRTVMDMNLLAKNFSAIQSRVNQISNYHLAIEVTQLKRNINEYNIAVHPR